MCLVLDMDSQTARLSRTMPHFTKACRGNVRIPPESNHSIEVRSEEIMCLRLSDEGHLIYLAVGSPSEEMLEMFKRVPGAGLSDRGRRCWRRSLRKDIRIFESLPGFYDVIDFLDAVEFPVRVIETEE